MASDAQRAGKIKWDLKAGKKVSEERRRWLREYLAAKRGGAKRSSSSSAAASSSSLARIADETFDSPTDDAATAPEHRGAGCPACGADVRDADRHCAKCGAAVRTDLCPGCDAPLGGARFCRQCGAAAATDAPPEAAPDAASDGEKPPAAPNTAALRAPFWTAHKCEMVISGANRMLRAQGLDELDEEESTEIGESLADVLNKWAQPAGEWAAEIRLGIAVSMALGTRLYIARVVIPEREARKRARELAAVGVQP